MSNGNPFIQDMIRMKIPEGMGSVVAYSGFTLTSDSDGCVTVPKSAVEAMQSHGLEPYYDDSTPAIEETGEETEKSARKNKKAEN